MKSNGVSGLFSGVSLCTDKAPPALFCTVVSCKFITCFPHLAVRPDAWQEHCWEEQGRLNCLPFTVVLGENHCVIFKHNHTPQTRRLVGGNFNSIMTQYQLTNAINRAICCWWDWKSRGEYVVDSFSSILNNKRKESWFNKVFNSLNMPICETENP